MFAVIPAAGRSRRMGQPKLLLSLGGRTVIARLAEALRHPTIRETVVVLRREDEPLRAAVVECGATPLQPERDPPDMRQSVQHALDSIRERYQPAADAGWLLIPADHPLLSRQALERLLSEWEASAAEILVPTYQGRRGHPTLFRWRFAEEVPAIPPDQGLNWLVRRHAAEIVEVPVDDPSVIADLDTPADYAAALQRLKESDPRP